MRSSIFNSRFDGDRTYYRERPARRVAEGFSIMFLVSLGLVVTLSTVRADAGAQHEARIAAGALAVDTHGTR